MTLTRLRGQISLGGLVHVKIINGGLETSQIKVTVDAHELQQNVYAMRGFGVGIKSIFLI